jgi:hypothetical protein
MKEQRDWWRLNRLRRGAKMLVVWPKPDDFCDDDEDAMWDVIYIGIVVFAIYAFLQITSGL